MAELHHPPINDEPLPREELLNCPRCGHELGSLALSQVIRQVEDEGPSNGYALDLPPPEVTAMTVDQAASLSGRLEELAADAKRGAPSKTLEPIVVENALAIERGQIADADRVARQLVRRLRAAGRLPQE